MDLISIIVPVYNVEKYLLRCVESIKNQSYGNIEIILVDDGSTDNCPQICEELKKTDSRIKVVHKENEGLGFARNSGLDVATGKYVTFIDSDDWIEDTHIENLYSAISQTKSDAAIGAHTSVNANGERVPHKITLEEGVYEGENILHDIILPLIGPDVDYPNDVQVNSSCCMNLYATNIIHKQKLRFISEKIAVAEDLYFNIDYFYYSSKLVAVNEVGYYYFENIDSISRKYNPKRFERTLNYYKELYNQVEKLGLTDIIKYRIDRSYLMKIRVAIRHIVISELQIKSKFEEIKVILNNEITQQVLKNYPIQTFIPLIRILTVFMRFKNVFAVYFLTKIRETAKKQRILKSVIRVLGIGK